MELRELRVLVAIAEHGGVSRAAKVLHLSPSAVSHSLAALEADLGVTLFHRLPRGMAPTEAGLAVLGPGRRALREAEAVQAAVGAVQGLTTGRLTLVPARLFVAPIVELVARFHARNPLVVTSLREPAAENVIAAIVRSGECEGGFMRSDLVPPDLQHTLVGRQTGAVVIPADHPLAALRTIRPVDLAGVAMIAPQTTSPFRPFFDGVFGSDGIEAAVVAESDHLETTVAMVRLGIGVAIAPVESASPILGEGAVVRPLEPAVTRPMSLVVRRESPLAPAAQAFWELARELHGADDGGPTSA
ncbi:MAG TPA: LysR family transcriptional regulator [Acidimicrobiales bacterium]